MIIDLIFLWLIRRIIWAAWNFATNAKYMARGLDPGVEQYLEEMKRKGTRIEP